jgi:hypothetical protein
MTRFDVRLSWLLSGMVILCMLVGGISCYYAGYYAASKEFYSYYMAESLNDRIVASLYTLYGDMDTNNSAGSSEESSESPEAVLDSESESNSHTASDQPERPVELIAPEEAHNRSAESLYDAYLIGFGAKRSADRYAERLIRDDVPARVITRENINSRGKKIVWYQVAVGPLAYHKLLEIVELLKYRDKLEGVVFVEYKS